MYSKNDYLEIMGIQRWRMRVLPPNPAADSLDFKELGIDFSSWILLNTQTHAPMAVLRLETNPLNFKEEEVEKLLDAMLTAVQLKRTASVANNQAPENLLQIIMGEALAQKLFRVSLPLDMLRAKNAAHLKRTTPILVTYHPKILLAEPKLKRNAWEDLKRLISR
jgi:hypothetical protein